ncbi:MAG: hypothetical protein HFE84_10815 [Lachnospiraceae bacterium]|nr:hypothetical protein [Lachnospiraceae bacterium]
MEKGYWKIGMAAAFLAVAGLSYGFSKRSGETALLETIKAAAETTAAMGTENAAEPKTECVYVYVCGEVAVPGVYELPAGSRVFEAIEQAGGFTKEAAAESLNLAAEVSDGMKLKVLSEAELEILPELVQAEDRQANLVNLNTASEAELMTLPGIGESRAKDIIRYREQSGGFQKIEDIMKVSGIKDAGFQKIKDRITV